jgi:hypothetical protein
MLVVVRPPVGRRDAGVMTSFEPQSLVRPQGDKMLALRLHLTHLTMAPDRVYRTVACRIGTHWSFAGWAPVFGVVSGGSAAEGALSVFGGYTMEAMTEITSTAATVPNAMLIGIL